MSRRGLSVLALSALLLTGCFTGKRPHFNDDPFPAGSTTGDAAIDAVLLKLDTVPTGPATAAYSVLTKFGNITNQAVVTLDAGSRSVTIGNVRFIQTAAAAATCTEDGTVPCTTTLDAARVSDIGVTIDFYSSEAATRLRRDSRAMIAPTISHVETIAEQAAICVDVPLAGGVAVYCALDSGLVARMDDGDVAVNLTMFNPTADPARLVVPVA
ncbi:MAG: hypothetical protein WCC60_20855 [Ilumatobacteraceae bacterium]